MVQPRVLVVVLAGGEGGRLEALTDRRAKPAVPYAGRYRLVDVVLSNVLHSGLSDVWLLEQTHPFSLQEHLSNGRPWDLDRTAGGLLFLHPRRGGDDPKDGWHTGTADALWRQTALIRDFAPDALVVLSADAVYALDYEAVVREHLASGASVTLVTTRVEADDAGRYGVVLVENGRVVDYEYKPDEPKSDLVANEVLVFDPGVLVDLLDELGSETDDLGDLGDEVLPQLVTQGDAREHRFEGYWRDLGTVEAYWSAHQDLLVDEPEYDPSDPAWPLHTRAGTHGPALVRRGAAVEDSLLSPGSTVAGTVRRSVLSPGVVVDEGAEVVESVLLEGVVVRAGARVVKAVVDRGSEIAAGVTVGGPGGEITLVGEEQVVSSDLAAGARLPESDPDA